MITIDAPHLFSLYLHLIFIISILHFFLSVVKQKKIAIQTIVRIVACEYRFQMMEYDFIDLQKINHYLKRSYIVCKKRHVFWQKKLNRHDHAWALIGR
jgi:hypothetical protein